MVSEFEIKKQEIKKKLLSAYGQLTAQATEEDDMSDLKYKAKGLLRELEFTATRNGLDAVESGIRSLENDLNRAKMYFH